MMASPISAKGRQFILIEMRVDTTEAVDGAEAKPLATQAKLVSSQTCMPEYLNATPRYWPGCLENGQSGGGNEYSAGTWFER
jgi:hypothetical protein